MTTALEGDEWSAACPSCTLPPGKTQYPFYRPPEKTQYPFYRRLDGPWGQSGQV